MADQLKEFYNASIGYADIKAGVDIVTCGAAQTAVVKDIVTDSLVDLSLLAGGTKVANAPAGNYRLTGSEIIPSDGALTIKADKIVWPFNKLIAFDDNSADTYVFPSVFKTPTATREAILAGSVAYSGLSGTYPYFAAFAANGDFYYGSSGAGTLYRRAGGVTGAQNAIASFYSPVYDGERYIYGVSDNNGTIRRHDTQTNTTVSLGASVPYSTSYGQTATLDGYVLVHIDSATAPNSFKIYDGATGALVGSLSSHSSSSAQRYFVAMAKRSDGDYVLIELDYTSPYTYWYNIGPDLSAPALKDSGTDTTIPVTFSDSGRNALFTDKITSSLVFYVQHSKLHYFDADTLAWGNQLTITGVSIASSYLPVWDETATAAAFPDVRVRATGILSTE